MIEKILDEIDKNYRFYYTIIYRHLRNHEDAEDVLQNICMKIIYKDPKIRSLKKLKSWIAIICSREAKTMLRTKKRLFLSDNALIHESEPITSYGIPEDLEFYYDDIVCAAIEMIPEEYQDALYDYYKDSVSFLHVAKKYGFPESTLRHWKKKVEKKIKEFL